VIFLSGGEFTRLVGELTPYWCDIPVRWVDMITAAAERDLAVSADLGGGGEEGELPESLLEKCKELYELPQVCGPFGVIL
jgi:hypothetical protein